MKRPEHIAGAIYDLDGTLLNNTTNQGNGPLDNLHQISRLNALRDMAHNLGGRYLQLLDVSPEENHHSFITSPVSTVPGAFFTLLKNRGLVDGEVDPAHPLVAQLVALKDEEYSQLLAAHGKPIVGADKFVRDLATHFAIEDKNAIASMAVLAHIKTFLATCDLSQLFPDSHIIDVGQVTRPKPHPEAFDKAFRALGLPDSARRNVPAFEDDPRGMLAAHKAGLFVCAITTDYSREFLENLEVKPDCIADSYDEFRDYFSLPN